MSKKLLSLILSNAGCPTKTTYQGTGPVNVTFDAADGLVIRGLLFHTTSRPTTAEDLVIRHQIPGEGAQFDVVRFQQDMDGVDNVVITGEDAIFMSKGDRLVIECANTENIPWGLSIIHGRNA
jgi:hypothetical protein